MSEPYLAAELIRDLDAAGIRRAVVFSDAYYFDSLTPTLQQPGPEAEVYPKVRAENDWTAGQVAQFPKRLAGFCGVNPLMDYAVAEVSAAQKTRSLQE